MKCPTVHKDHGHILFKFVFTCVVSKNRICPIGAPWLTMPLQEPVYVLDLQSKSVGLLTSTWLTNRNAGFRPSLPLSALPLRRVITACHFRVAALSSHAATVFSLSSIAPKLNRSQLSPICRCGQSGQDTDWLLRRCLPLCLLSAASGAWAVAQISSSKRQCSEGQASQKAA